MQSIKYPNSSIPLHDSFNPGHLPENSLRMVPLGGLGEVGRNMMALEMIDPITHGDPKLLLIDCGVLFPGEDQPGVDLILPDFSFIADRLDRVEALVITHGHEDHIGGIPYLLKLKPDILLIGSKLTLALIQKKLDEHHIKPRTFEVKEGDFYQAGPFALEFLPVNHSIPDALAVFVKTAAGNVLNTGDFKMDQLPLDGRITDLREFSKAGEAGVDVFMVDSTNAEHPGFVRSESEIAPNIATIFAKHEKYNPNHKIYISSFASHIHRIQAIIDIAQSFGKFVCFVGRSMIANMKIAQDLGYLTIPENLLVDYKTADRIAPSKLVIVATGSQGEELAALSRMSQGTAVKFNIEEGDTVIMASSSIPGNEKSISALINRMKTAGANVWTSHETAIHCSGHANQGELRYIYNVVKPRNVMPIHGEIRHLLANADVAHSVGIDPQNIAVAKNGVIFELNNSEVKIVGKIKNSYIYVDGKSIDTITDEDLDHRKTLSEEGFIVISVTVDFDKKTVITKPKITAKGMAENDEVFYKLSHKITKELTKAMIEENILNNHKLAQKVRRIVGSFVGNKLRRSPMILPIVTNKHED